MKIRPVGAELFHADDQTEVTKLTVACRNFATSAQWTELKSPQRLFRYFYFKKNENSSAC